MTYDSLSFVYLLICLSFGLDVDLRHVESLMRVLLALRVVCSFGAVGSEWARVASLVSVACFHA